MAADDITLDRPKPSRLPMVIISVVALALGGGAGFGASVLLSTDTSAEAAESPDAPVTLEGPDGEPVVIDQPNAAVMLDLGRFTVNLRGGGSGRTLRMQVQVQTRAQHEPELTRQIPPLRDAVLSLASDYTYHDVEGLEGKQRLRDDLHAATGAIVGVERIERLFFTEFIVN